MNSYESRVAAKKERLNKKADALITKADKLHDDGMTALKAIPFGQPVMPDHHSYKSDISYRKKATGKIEKAHHLYNAADEAERRADAVGTGGVSQDDPDAIPKLEQKLASLKAHHEVMKKINLDARKKGGEVLPAYMLANSNANIRRYEKRIEQLRKVKSVSTIARHFVGKGWEVIDKIEDNRVHFIFEGKPEEDVRAVLKQNGFKWSPSRGAWVRFILNSKYATDRVISFLRAKE